jgi:hypothetical protein
MSHWRGCVTVRLAFATVVILAIQAQAQPTVLNCTITRDVVDGKSRERPTQLQTVEAFAFDEEKQTLRYRSDCESVQITPEKILGICEDATIQINRTDGQIEMHSQEVVDARPGKVRRANVYRYGTCRKRPPQKTQF